MENKLTTEIIQRMLPYLDNAQLIKLRDVLGKVLVGVELSDDYSEDESNESLLNSFAFFLHSLFPW